MTDVVIVETSDHARLQIQLSYNWFFDINRSEAEDAAKIFQVPDFVGDACKASRSPPVWVLGLRVLGFMIASDGFVLSVTLQGVSILLILVAYVLFQLRHA